MATVLNSLDTINSVGELHQFYTYLKNNENCSCGMPIKECDFWNKVVKNIGNDDRLVRRYMEAQTSEESHKNIPLILLGKKPSEDYCESQKILFEELSKATHNHWLLDSSKYVGRFLLLARGNFVDLRGIYVVRDIRGVINSFKKKVQTQKNPFASILYHTLVNFFAQLVCWTNKNVIKIRYEDFIEDPIAQINRIKRECLETGEEKTTALENNFTIPHIVGGNRLKQNKSISLKKDDTWKMSMSRPKQILYFFLGLPYMVINRYKL